MRIDGFQPVGAVEQPGLNKVIASDPTVPSFKETFATFLSEVDDAQKSASDAQKKFLAGEVTDVHQVMNKSEQANTAFNMLMELRNKGLDGFQELMRVKL